MIIKFSYIYNKMPSAYQHSKLLAVFPVELDELGLDFILYDTSYLDGSEEKQYPLPARGNYMVLLLKAAGGKGLLWTTIRSQTGKGGIDKMAYYKSHIGEVVECKVTE